MRDIYGRPRLRGEGLTGVWAIDMVLPWKTETPKDEPGLRMIVENMIEVPRLRRTLVGPTAQEVQVDPVRAAKLQGVSLTNKEYDRFGAIIEKLEIGGQTLKERLDEIAGESDLYDFETPGPDGSLALRVKQEIYVYRRTAQEDLMDENDGALRTRIEEYYLNKAERLLPSRPSEAETGPELDAGIRRMTR
jgi:hypothetical protein